MTFQGGMVESKARSHDTRRMIAAPRDIYLGEWKMGARRGGWLGSLINIGVFLSMGLNKSVTLCLAFGSLSRQGWGRGEGRDCVSFW